MSVIFMFGVLLKILFLGRKLLIRRAGLGKVLQGGHVVFKEEESGGTSGMSMCSEIIGSLLQNVH